MNGPQAIQAALGSTQWLLNEYVKDMTDADLLVRPAAGANHIAWQIGHVTAGEIMMVAEQLPDVKYPPLPAGYNELHAGAGAGVDDPAKFQKKDALLKLFNEVRQATIAHVGTLTDADLDKPTKGTMAPFAPKLGDLLILAANHTTMHAGQFTVARRKLGKPVLF